MIEIQKNIQPPSLSRHPIEEALTYLRDHGNFGDSIVLPPEMAKGARAYYPRVATDTKIFKVSPEGENGAVRVWLLQATPFVAPGLVADPVSPIAPAAPLSQTLPTSPLMPADLAALAFPDESLADLKMRLLTELTRLRSMAVGRLDMTDAERAMLTTLEGQVAQQWFSS